MKAYKLVKQRKDGSLGSLFVDASRKLPVGLWMPAINHKPKALKERMGWHCLKSPNAPHLSKDGRVWVEVECSGAEEINRPECQGGTWLLAKQMKIVGIMDATEIKADAIYSRMFKNRLRVDEDRWRMIQRRDCTEHPRQVIVSLLSKGFTVTAGYYTCDVRGWHEYYILYR